MDWVFLSPHFDDAVLSCGGLIWERTQAGDSVHIWTICAGEVPAGELSPFAEKLHQRWQTGSDAVSIRRVEDFHACQRVGASLRYFPIPDCIYRRNSGISRKNDSSVSSLPRMEGDFLYPTQESIFGDIHPAEQDLIARLGDTLRQTLPNSARLVSPLAVGSHVDHQIARQLAETIGGDLLFYADFPYVLEDPHLIERLSGQDWKACLYPVSKDGLQAWYESIAAYQSQISTFWSDLGELWDVLAKYLDKNGGVKLWGLPGSAQRR